MSAERAARTGELATDVGFHHAGVEAWGLARDYRIGSTVVHALADVDIAVSPGELVAVHGRSGSGKTTLLNLIGGLDEPTRGRVRIAGTDLGELSGEERVRLRGERLGFVFQAFGLLPILSAAENVEVPLRLRRTDPAVRDARVRELLDLVGLSARAGHRPEELSGGEQQRVAVARALANSPQLLIADEPTGQLDSGTGARIMALLRDVVSSQGVAAIVATHDAALIDMADRVVELRDGRVHRGADLPGH